MGAVGSWTILAERNYSETSTILPCMGKSVWLLILVIVTVVHVMYVYV